MRRALLLVLLAAVLLGLWGTHSLLRSDEPVSLPAIPAKPGSGALGGGAAPSKGPGPDHPARQNLAGKDLPTVSGIDLDAFPRLPDEHGPRSGRVLWVSRHTGHSGLGYPESPIRSIQEAVARAEAGTTIRVKAGTYDDESPGDYRAIVIEKDGISIVAHGDGPVVLKPRAADQRYGITIGGSDILIRGIDLHGFTRSAVYLGRSDGRAQRNIVIADMDIVFPADGVEGCGIVAYSDHRKSGVPVVDGLLVHGVSVVDPKILGISCNFGPCINWRIEQTRVKMSPSSFGSSGADAFAMESGRNFLFRGVRAQGPRGDGIDVKGHQVAIYDSEVVGVGRNAIKLWHEGDIVNTMVVGSGADAAIVFVRAGRYRILHCTVVEHNYPEPSSYLMTVGYNYPNDLIELSVRNSVFHRHSGGIYLSRSTMARLDSNLFGEIRGDNLLTIGSPDPKRLVFIPNGPRGLVRLEDLGLGSGNLWHDKPGFVDPANKDFRLSPDSLHVVDRGSRAEAYPHFDRSGKARVRGGGPDLGPDELR